MSVGKARLISKDFWKTKVPQFDIRLAVQKNIGWLYVPMQNFTVLLAMDLVEGEHYLHKELPDDILRDTFSIFSALLDELR